MKLIELHYGGRRYSLNVDFITGVAFLDGGGCHVWVLGEPVGNPSVCDESYEEVIQLIKEATNEAPTVDAVEVVRCEVGKKQGKFGTATFTDATENG